MPSYIDQMYGVYTSELELYHHGILGQRWGVRRYQNADGSLTDAGKRRVAKQEYRSSKKNIENTRKSKLSSDYEKTEGDMLYGTTSLNEALRRNRNSNTFRSQQARASKYDAKAKMMSKLSENSQGFSKKYRDRQTEVAKQKSMKYSKLSGKTKNMIDVTNDVYATKLSKGEKIVSELLLSPEDRNVYMMDVAKGSKQQAAGKAIAKKLGSMAFRAAASQVVTPLVVSKIA